MFYDLRKNLVQPFDDAGFGLAECHLIRHLENVAQRFGALAIKPADGEAQLVHGLDDGVDLLVKDETGEVQHGTDPDASAEVGGAGGEIADLGAEGVIEFSFKGSIGLINGEP